MNNNARKWLAALRSGKFLQGRGQLAFRTQNKKVKYCCLGVACTVYEKETGIKIKETFGDNISFDNWTETLSDQVIEWLGLRSDVGSHRDESKNSCATMNDEMNMSFKEIADELEKNASDFFI